MANNKLQELTEQLYNMGLAKGRIEGDKYLDDAKAKAAQIVKDAQSQAEKIIADAEKKAADIAAESASDVKTASFQALEATRNDIINAISAKIVDAPVEKALASDEFTKELIMTVARNFSTEGAKQMSIVLGENSKLQAYVEKEVSAAVGEGIDVSLSKNVGGGLRIGPADGSYYISLSEDTFKQLICEYLRPITRKTLFGE